MIFVWGLINSRMREKSRSILVKSLEGIKIDILVIFRFIFCLIWP